MKKQITGIRLLLMLLTAMLAGCGGLTGGEEAPAGAAEEAAGPTATPTDLALAPTLNANTLAPPTLTATAEGAGGPTPLPDPTQMGAATATPEGEEGDEDGGEEDGEGDVPAVNTGNTGPGIVISPQLGAPLDVIVVNGTGFEPNETVTFHWGAVDGATGPKYWSMETDDNGNFEIGLKVPPADRWPSPPPEERDLLQLRVFAESLDENYYFANFTYIPRVDPVTSLVQTYTNEEYGYSIRVPNQWTWSWVEDDVSDVRFASPNTGNGFVRVEAGENVSALIPTVMGQEFSGQSYTTQTTSVGQYEGTEAVLDNGRMVQFIPSGGQTYVLSFVDDNGQFDTNIHGSLTLE